MAQQSYLETLIGRRDVRMFIVFFALYWLAVLSGALTWIIYRAVTAL